MLFTGGFPHCYSHVCIGSGVVADVSRVCMDSTRIGASSSQQDLRDMRDSATAELLWIEQAITSRKQVSVHAPPAADT